MSKIMVNGVYVFKMITTITPYFLKLEAIEVTETTYFFRNLDTGASFRDGRDTFDQKHRLVEVLKDPEKEMREKLKVWEKDQT